MNCSWVNRWVACLLAVAMAAGMGFLTYAVVRNQLLIKGGWKVLAEPTVVEVAPTSVDSPKRSQWNEATVDVALRNITGSPVRIVGVQSSCGCISSVDQYPFVLNPHDQKRVQFRLQFDDQLKDGETLGTASFFLDEPSPKILVSFQAKLRESG
jgi:hypothetical protein